MATSFEDARSTILDNVHPLPAQALPLLEAVGLAVAEDVLAPRNMPLWDNSAMDGFAVRSQDCDGQTLLQIIGYLPAGESAAGRDVAAGTAIKIMTGAPVPAGADAVVPVEETDEDGDQVLIKTQVRPGDHIRYCGEDVQAGELSIAAGTLLRPVDISLLASFGKATVKVYRRVRVAILSTGNELIEVGEPLADGKIIDSNSLALAAAVKELGGEPVLLGIAMDDVESLQEKISKGLQADVLLTSAGVSAGDKDLVRQVLHAMKVEPVFWKVEIKPGRPTAFGLWQGRPVFSLPGNPVSSLLTFEQFVRPALLTMMGHRQPLKPCFKATLAAPIAKKPGRVHFLRVQLSQKNQQLFVVSAGDQNTGILKTLLRADALAILPAERESFAAGEEVDVQLLSPAAQFFLP